MTEQKRKKIVAIPGSTRKNSTNHSLMRALAALKGDQLEITIFDGIAGLPHFDPDLEGEKIPGAVREFKDLLNAADGIIICTPEYAHGVPGTLKNAIDWTVYSCEFSHKPTVLITASSEGRWGHAALLETLRVLEAEKVDELQLLIPFVRTKIDSAGKIIHEETLKEVRTLMDNFIRMLKNPGNL